MRQQLSGARRRRIFVRRHRNGQRRIDEPFAATKLSPSSAALLWQDAPALLSDVRLEEGRVHFTAGEGQGNVLIAVRDADGRILWS